MSSVRLVFIALLVTGAALASPGAAVGASTPVPACNGGGCGGWFRSNVTVTWSYDPAGLTSPGCGPTTITEDTAGTSVACSLMYGPEGRSYTVSVQKDSSPPSVSGSLARGPDAAGWYTSPVGVTFTGDGGPSGISSCTSGTYGGPDGAAVSVGGSCTDGAGNTGSGSVTIKYDGSAPVVTPATDRPPDADGWYNHPVKVAFSGQDAGSGVKECSPPVAYGGPDANPAKLVGQCRDAAGHLSAPVTLELRYDATKPSAPVVKAKRKPTSVSLSWTKVADTVRADVVRAPGLKDKKPSVVWSGKGSRLVDRKVRPDSRYWYQVRLYDQAGNVASKTLAILPAVGILAPGPGAVVRRPPLVSWSPVKKARFYNVQLWRGRSKLLTTWPSKAKLKLTGSWTFQGKRQRLTAGRYRLFVWPAFGTLAEPRYGKLVGRVGFVVKRR